MSWLAIYVPALPLQAFSRTLIDSAPVVVFEGDRRSHIAARNRSAARLGVTIGATLAEANALSNALVALPREPLREVALLQRMAGIASILTPNVHVSVDFGLQLDVTASLQLFGGAEGVAMKAQQLMHAEQLRCHVVVAATARGARWLARAHRELVAANDIADWLDDLAFDCTDFDSGLVADLHALNLHTLAAVRRLPIASLSKRFGAALTTMLREAYGEVGEALPFWAPTRRFEDHVEFTDLAREQSHWMPGVVGLLDRLEAYLTLHASASTTIVLRFIEGSIHATAVPLQAAHAMHLANEWLRLANVKLERVPIPHEISRIELSCEQIEPMQFESIDLFDRSAQHDRDWSALGALLKLRLGDNSVRRPYANRSPLLDSVAPAVSMGMSAARLDDAQPTWLVHPARRLNERDVASFSETLPIRQPERLCDDWAQPDGAAPIERDYYVATTRDDRTLWVFRDRVSHDWFLQGVFG